MTTKAKPLPQDLKPQENLYDRMSLQFSAHYEHLGDPITSVISNTSQVLLASDLEVYSRRCKADHVWDFVDLGWYKDHSDKIGLILFENLKPVRTVAPTQEEKLADAKRVLVIGHVNNSTNVLVLPGCSQFVRVDHPSSLQVRCEFEETNFRITIFPYNPIPQKS